MAHESFPNYPTLADAIEAGERVTVRWSYDNVRNLSEGQVAAIVAALRASTVSEKKPCEWRADADGVYHTGCGNSWFFDTGNASDNKVKFCCYCGGDLKPIEYVDPILGDEVLNNG